MMQNTSQVDIGEVLKSWGCEESIIQVFKDNEITVDQLPLLNAALLKEMVPKMGPRMLLLEKLEEMTQKGEDSTEHRECSLTTVTDLSGISEIIDEMETNQLVLATNEDPHINADLIIEKDLLNFLRPKFEDFDLKTLLTTSPLGKSIINYYGTNKKLDNTRRNRLVSIIVKHLYNYIVKNRLTQEDYNTLGAKIISLFPMETLGIYYCPPIRKSDHPLKKSVMAKGKLVNHVRNILFRSGDTSARRSITQKRTFHEVEDEEKENEHQNTDLARYTEDIVWLKHNSEPWTKVIEKWGNTYPCRKNAEIHNLNEYYEAWPILNDLRAYILINLDFEKIYPQSQIAFHLKWETFFDKILKYKIQEIRDITAQNIYRQLLDKNDDDEKLPLQLTLLNYMLPPRGRTKTWKFSILESIEGIILHVQNPGDVQARVDACIERAYNRKQTVQPYLVVEGDTLDKIRNTYIVFDKVKYQFQSVAEAFDVLFKSYHVMNLKYPSQSAHIFQLIQNGVYNISTKFDVIYPENLEVLRLFQE